MMQKTVYRASGSTNKSEKSICKIVGNTISSNSEDSVSCQLKIPVDVSYSVWNCEIISVEYYLKVYLDISFAIDPMLMFPLVVIPCDSAAFQPVGSYPGGAAGGPSYSDFPPPAFPGGAYPVPVDSYGYPAPHPSQHATIGSCYDNELPQYTVAYGFSNASSSGQHQPPTGPPQFQEGDQPPSYTSLFPPSHESK
uniref:arrestin domain-containing protein 3-like n=1 Tax=Monopterus albus TaxID=43700 RepID=UPI0009B42F84|nr:arrestin domain-containing protein 3-like [Monopterus albus]